MVRSFLLFLFAAVASCAQPTTKIENKLRPSYSTEITDPELKVITDEFFKLSARNDIVFDHRVSMGFSEIKKGQVIGYCSFNSRFREIDLDKDYWKRSSWLSKIALVYHELAHCYCERDHDFDDGEKYPEDTLDKIIDNILVKQPLTPLKPPGYLDDFCPKSIMHPTILDDYCFERHYAYYVKEMFARCEPW